MHSVFSERLNISGGLEKVEVTEDKSVSTGETTEELKQTVETTDVSQEVAVESAASQELEPERSDRRMAGQKKVVKKLAVGQQLKGKVKRVAEFGAFIDIGVGRDGLVHISEMSWNRVNKVTDVVSEGQEVDVWIKELDRERNRISLTMRKPPEVDIQTLQPDMIIQGKISRIVPYGAFVDIGTGREALLHIREMSNGYVKNPGDIVTLGQEIEAKVIKVDSATRQVDLSIKELIAPAEGESKVEERGEAEAPEEPEEELPTAMEVALKEAFETEGKEPHWVTRRRQERRKKDAKRRDQDEILTRTLHLHKKWDD
jgi:small subunit ribosomal protein S1